MTPAKVLAVDDVRENLVALEAVLKGADVQLLCASSGEQALELLLEHDVAVALLDVQMPGMDGFELAELMRGSPRTRQIPIIFVTAAPRDLERVFRGYEAGAVDFLNKPLNADVLRSKVAVFVELHQQRRQLAEQVVQLRQALALNEAFVAVLGHDLRNPLTAVLTGAMMLERRASDESARRAAERVVRSTHRMRRLIDQLLCFARVRAGQPLPLAPVATDLREVLAHVLEEYAEADVARVAVDIVGEPCGTWDPDRLLQAISNLVGNALKHGAPEQPVRVRVDGARPDEVRIVVANAGAISGVQLPRIFEPFASGSGGLGLGLYIVRTFSEAHGGHVLVSSSEAEGTRFEIRLPRSAAAR